MRLEELNKEHVSDRIKSLYHERKDSKLSLGDIAKSTGISKGTLNTYFNRGSIPSVLHAWVLCEFFNKSISWLITGTETKDENDPLKTEIVKIFEEQSDETKLQILKIARTFSPHSYSENPKGGTGSATKAG